jgi:hypothetical protein
MRTETLRTPYRHHTITASASVTLPSEDSNICGTMNMRTELEALVDMESITIGSRVTLGSMHLTGSTWISHTAIAPLKVKLKSRMTGVMTAKMARKGQTAATWKLGVKGEVGVEAKAQAQGLTHGP